jgi:Transcription factor WhiB
LWRRRGHGDAACSRLNDPDDPSPRSAIEAFDKGTSPQIVSVNMISEGVDIRRSRPGSPALAICNSCPVRTDCLALSLQHWDIGQHGIWGGLLAAERAKLRRRLTADGNGCAGALMYPIVTASAR